MKSEWYSSKLADLVDEKRVERGSIVTIANLGDCKDRNDLVGKLVRASALTRFEELDAAVVNFDADTSPEAFDEVNCNTHYHLLQFLIT